jgi:hypothetical protein
MRPNLKRQTMRISFLRYLFLVDAGVLAVVGALLIFVPRQIENLFGFHELPAAVSYLIGLWGCVLASLALGYIVAAANPVRHRVWAQVGIARGVLECVLGIFYLAQGIVTFHQAGFGVVVAFLITMAYLILYPRKPRLIAAENPNPRPAVSS